MWWGSYVTSIWSQKKKKSDMELDINSRSWCSVRVLEKWNAPLQSMNLILFLCPVQMSLGISFGSRSLPRIRRQQKHLLNRSDMFSCSLSLSFFSVELYVFCICIFTFFTFRLTASFLVSLFLHLYIHIYKWVDHVKSGTNFSGSYFHQSQRTEKK